MFLIYKSYTILFMRKLNTLKINEWLTINGELSREDLASKARIKFHTLKRIIAGEKMASELEQFALAKALEVERDVLFPITSQEKYA